jgi:hypothetical protein
MGKTPGERHTADNMDEMRCFRWLTGGCKRHDSGIRNGLRTGAEFSYNQHKIGLEWKAFMRGPFTFMATCQEDRKMMVLGLFCVQFL